MHKTLILNARCSQLIRKPTQVSRPRFFLSLFHQKLTQDFNSWVSMSYVLEDLLKDAALCFSLVRPNMGGQFYMKLFSRCSRRNCVRVIASHTCKPYSRLNAYAISRLFVIAETSVNLRLGLQVHTGLHGAGRLCGSIPTSAHRVVSVRPRGPNQLVGRRRIRVGRELAGGATSRRAPGRHGSPEPAKRVQDGAVEVTA